MRFTANETQTLITGRTLTVEDVRYLGYSGTSVSFTFVGKRASACLVSDAGSWPDDLQARVAVFVNGESDPSQRITLTQKEQTCVLWEAAEPQETTITLMKYSEATFGLCGIKWLETDSEALLPPPARKTRHMEIIGDSITCGYGVEAQAATEPFHTATENPTKSYSLLTAAALDAEPSLVSWSGNGIISKFVGEDAEVPLIGGLMPELYPYTDLSASQRLLGDDPAAWEKWDFARHAPDVILLNLGTNDASWCKDVPARHEDFRMAYEQFLRTVRASNPGIPVVCLLGTMDLRLLDDVEAAVKAMEDENVHFLPLPLQQAADGYGADWHPSLLTHQKTTDILVPYLRTLLSW